MPYILSVGRPLNIGIVYAAVFFAGNFSNSASCQPLLQKSYSLKRIKYIVLY
jgi:hypothetical protein